MATDSQHLMVVSTLARKLHEAQRAKRPAFAQPTLVVMPALVAEGLAQHPTLLNTWPDRRNPRPWQALTRWCESPGSWDTLFGVARQLGVDLPNLGPVGDTGQTFLEWARARQEAARQAVVRELARSQTGFTIVMTHRDGRQVTQGQEYQGRWSRALALQQALEQWDKLPMGRRLGP